MFKLEDAAKKAAKLVATKEKHQDYDRVVKLSRQYYRPMITGVGLDNLMRQFNRREDIKAFEQRKAITQHITPSVTNTLASPARKIAAVKPVVDRADFGTEQDAETKKLKSAMSTFYEGKNIDHYLGSRPVELSMADPNSFVLLTFDSFDNRYEEPITYPVEVLCEDAWNFEYHNGILQWLLVHKEIEYIELEIKPPHGPKAAAHDPTEKTKVLKGDAFFLYTEDHHIVFTRIRKEFKPIGDLMVIVDDNLKPVTEFNSVQYAAVDKYFFRVSNEELYMVEFFNQKSGVVPAFRCGYIKDQETDGRTCVNLWHPSLPWLLKSIKSVSEMDLTASLHAFPRLIQYQRACMGKPSKPCSGGKDSLGNTCGACGGTGVENIVSSQDHITLRMPKVKDDMIPLADIAHYVQLPEGIIKWMDEYVDKLIARSMSSTYNSDVFTKARLADTATKEVIDLQSVYDALQPLAMWFSACRVLIVKVLAAYTVGREQAMKKLIVEHKFPRNFKFETTGIIVSLMKEAVAGGGGQAVMANLNMDLIENLYVDDTVALKRAKAMAYFDPFAGKTEATVLSLITQGLTTKENSVLWGNMAYVFSVCEEEAKGKALDFYEQPRDKQKQAIDKVVAQLIKDMDKAAEEAMERMPDATGLNPETGEEEPGGTSDELPTSEQTDAGKQPAPKPAEVV